MTKRHQAALVAAGGEPLDQRLEVLQVAVAPGHQGWRGFSRFPRGAEFHNFLWTLHHSIEDHPLRSDVGARATGQSSRDVEPAIVGTLAFTLTQRDGDVQPRRVGPGGLASRA